MFIEFLISNSIWNYLLTLTNDKRSNTLGNQTPPVYRKQQRTTIIITTHYIEEARQCSIVGMMSDGHLLAEDMPQSLLEIHNTVTLEEVFLKLCISQRSKGITKTSRSNGILNGIKRASVTSLFGTCFFNWQWFRDKKVVLTVTVFWAGDVKKAKGDQNGHPSTLERNGTLTSEGLVYPGMTASKDDFGIQPLSYARRSVEKNPSMRVATRPGNIQVKSHSFLTWTTYL